MSSTFSGTGFPGWYFAIQGLAIAAWWLYLWGNPSATAPFIPPGAGSVDLVSFRLPDLLVVVPTSAIAALTFFTNSRWSVPLAWAAAGAMDYAFFYCLAWSWYREGGWLGVALMAPAALFSTVGAIDASAAQLPLFHRAAAARTSRHVAATVVQIVMFWSFFLFIVPAAIVAVERQLAWPNAAFAGQRIAAVTLFGLCSCLGLASGLTMAARGSGTPLPFDAPNRLVVSGPYAYLRNPMVVAGLGQGFAVGLWCGSPAVLAYVATGGLVWNFLVRPAEERDLLDTFGSEFSRYRDEVGCWVPRRRPFRARP